MPRFTHPDALYIWDLAELVEKNVGPPSRDHADRLRRIAQSYQAAVDCCEFKTKQVSDMIGAEIARMDRQ